MWSQSLACFVSASHPGVEWLAGILTLSLLRGPQLRDIVVQSHTLYCDINTSYRPGYTWSMEERQRPKRTEPSGSPWKILPVIRLCES